MYALYIGNKNYSSWSLRPWVLMHEFGIAFDERLAPFGTSGGQGGFRSFSPTGKVPCLVDGSTIVWDSLGIVEYLAERHVGVWPADASARVWARCAAAEMHSSFGTLCDRLTMNLGLRVRLHDTGPSPANDIARIESLWNEGLERFGGPFLSGAAFGAVDAFYAPVAFRFQSYGVSTGVRATSYVQRLLDLPSMRDWYRAALAETWRDGPHEVEARRTGTWTSDLRARPDRGEPA